MTKESDLRVSVVIPTYNCVAMLPQAIQSAYGQSDPPDEVIVVNDGCTDETDVVVRRMIPELPDSFKYIAKENGGEANARNTGVRVATGEVIAFLDQDDLWHHDKLRLQKKHIDNPAVSLCFTSYERRSAGAADVVHVPGWDATPAAAVERLLDGCCITPSTVLVRRQALLDLGLFDEDLPLGCDWDMWFRLALDGRRLVYVDQPLTEYRLLDTSMSSDKRKIAIGALMVFDKVFARPDLPARIEALRRASYARWELNHAEFCLDQQDGRSALRHLAAAVRYRPASFRIGWLRLGVHALRQSLR